MCNTGFSLLVPAGRLPVEPKMIWPWGFDAGNLAPMTAEALSPEENELIVADLRVEGRRIWFETIEKMQAMLDDYLKGYNTKRPHQERGMNGRTPIRAFTEGMPKTNHTQVTSQAKTAKLKAASGPLQMRSLSGEYRRCTSSAQSGLK